MRQEKRYCGRKKKRKFTVKSLTEAFQTCSLKSLKAWFTTQRFSEIKNLARGVSL
jgi:hypothetical protein